MDRNGSLLDIGTSIAVDSAGNAYVTGYTESFTFPTVDAPQATFGGVHNAFVAKLDRTGCLLYSTFLGGGQDDEGYSIVVDSGGAAYVTGFTDSPNFPTIKAIQPTLGGGYDAFITRIDPPNPTSSTMTALMSSPSSSPDSQQVTFTASLCGSNPLTVGLNQSTFKTGDTLVLPVAVEPDPGLPPLVDVYLVLQLTDGSFFSLFLDGSVVSGIAPLASAVSWPTTPLRDEILWYVVSGSTPQGRYRWLAALAEAGTANLVSAISEAPFDIDTSRPAPADRF